MRRPIHGGNLAWAAALAGCSPSLILDFSASINPLGPPKSAIAAIESHLNDLIAYPDPNYYELKEVLSQLHPTLTADWILPGNGSAELLTWAARELSELEETYLITPAFSDYQRALKAFDAKIREYRLFVEADQGTTGQGGQGGQGGNSYPSSLIFPTPGGCILFNNRTAIAYLILFSRMLL